MPPTRNKRRVKAPKDEVEAEAEADVKPVVEEVETPLILCYFETQSESQRGFVPAENTFDDMIYSILARFDRFRYNYETTLFVRVKTSDGIVEAPIDETIWPGALKQLGLVRSDNGMQEVLRVKYVPYGSPPLFASTKPKIKVFVKTLTQKTLTFNIHPDYTVMHLKCQIQDKEGIPTDQQRAIFGGRQMQDDETLEELNICNNATVHLVLRLSGDKPVIYLYPPKPTNVSVKLALSPEWSFSSVYPSTAISPMASASQVRDQWEHLRWNVRAKPDGALQCLDTGAKITYLFWEADSNKPFPIDGVFSPANPVLTPDCSTAVALPVNQVPGYLDRSLETLGLTPGQRTDFITYWLASINKHKHLALRFLPQKEYEQAAPLELEPPADIVARVFLLFMGIKEIDLGKWENARARASEDVDWVAEVGLDKERMADTSLFRVLKWGGMEVL